MTRSPLSMLAQWCREMREEREGKGWKEWIEYVRKEERRPLKARLEKVKRRYRERYGKAEPQL